MILSEGPQGAATVCGVVVTYQPDPAALDRLLQAIRPQLDMLVIIDNGSHLDIAAMPLASGFNVMALGDNYGIARAQNVGIDYARAQAADYVLLLDQDSVPAPDMVEKLLTAAVKLQAKGVKVAAVGPRYLDQRQGETAPFVYLDGLSLKRRPCPEPDSIVETDFLIASGCLLPMANLEQIGPMVEALFIDYVDIEWGLRAKRLQYRSFGVCAAHMEHALGDEWMPFRGRQIPAHSPLRHYYHIRNAIWLGLRPWLPAAWRAVLAWRLVRQFLFFSILAPHGSRHARMMTLGFWHGATNRMGRK
jgi:rhamnosyltransferase